MGPFDLSRQHNRAKVIKDLLTKNPNLNPRMKAIWENHLKNIAFTEDEYNSRVVKYYQSIQPYLIAEDHDDSA